MSSKEIVTVQIGQYSNYIGTHWWNLQESSFVYDPKVLSQYPKEVDHDILFREGRTIKGDVTFTPRLVLFDLNGGLGSLKQEGTLYKDPSEDNVKWVGDVTLHQVEPAPKNRFLEDLEEEGLEQNETDQEDERKIKASHYNDAKDSDGMSSPKFSGSNVFGKHFYDLDKDVVVWSDYLRSGIHRRSIHLLSDNQHDNPEKPFNIFGLGEQALRTGDQWDLAEDRLRFFTEECDHLQGFHILLDSHNAFGSIANSVLAYLSDEFSNKARFSFGVTPASLPDQTALDRSARIICSALTLHHCVDHSSLYVPLSLASSLWRNMGSAVELDNLQYKASLDYHTSAVLAAALDTATMPYRKECDPAGIVDITSSFSSHGRKVSALNASLPFPLRVGGSFAESLLALGTVDPWTSLTPHVKCTSSPTFHSCVVRGIPADMVKRDAQSRSAASLSSCSSLDDVICMYMSETYPDSCNSGCVMRDGINVGSPFPHIFSPFVNQRGFVTATQRAPFCGVESVSAITSLQSSPEISSYVDSLVDSISRFNIQRHQHFIETGLESEEFTEMLEELKNLAQCYKPNN